jgi:hypothetical protein
MVETIAPALDKMDRLRQLAAQILSEHTNQDERCAVCDCAFPCDQAVLAEHNLAL